MILTAYTPVMVSLMVAPEIKNKLDYIDAEELTAKIEMCRHLGLKPLFIMRGSPQAYNHDINLAGGFALIYRYQLYPHGQGDGGHVSLLYFQRVTPRLM